MPSTATVTGTTGPGLTVAATVFTNVSRFEFDTDKELITIYQSGGSNPPASISIAAATTLTLTVVAPNNYTLTIS